MANIAETLPEGTDSIIEDTAVLGAEETDADGDDAEDGAQPEQASAADGETDAGQQGDGEPKGTFREQAAAKGAELRGQATDHAFAFAAQGKDRATEALDAAAKFVSDAADQVEEKLGPQYAGYARQAAEAVTGVAATLRDKDVGELFDDARGYVRKSPAIAIGAAAAAGFVLARLIKAGSETLGAAAKDLHDDPTA